MRAATRHRLEAELEHVRGKLGSMERAQETSKAGLERLRRQVIDASYQAGLKSLGDVFRRQLCATLGWRVHRWREAVVRSQLEEAMRDGIEAKVRWRAAALTTRAPHASISFS